MIKTIRLAGVICNQRSFHDYTIYCRKLMAEYFGFDGVGIMFYDKTTGNFFSNIIDKTEADLEIIKL